MTAAAPHIPVLLDEVVAALAPRPGMTIVDLGSAPGSWSQVAALESMVRRLLTRLSESSQPAAMCGFPQARKSTACCAPDAFGERLVTLVNRPFPPALPFVVLSPAKGPLL